MTLAELGRVEWWREAWSRVAAMGRGVRHRLPLHVWVGVLAIAATPVVLLEADGGKLRLLVAGVALGCLGLSAFSRPRLSIAATLVYLGLLGEGRRLLLLADAPWSGMDPMVLVGPAMALLLGVPALCYRRVGLTLTSKLVLGLMVIMVVQVFNPLQGSPLVGLAGAMFYLCPIFWFWVGREYGHPAYVGKLLAWVVGPIAVVGALMGIWQGVVGFGPHHEMWLKDYSYAAVWITATQARAMSIFTSGQEFAVYMTIGLALAAAWAWGRGVAAAWLLAPLCLAGAFFQASRGPMVTMVGLMGVMWAVRSLSPRWWLPRLAGGLLVLGTVGYVGLTSVDLAAVDPSLAPVVSHQVGGLTNPFDEEHSTAGAHASMKFHGVMSGFTNPVGYGLGSTSIAASKFGGEARGSAEVDFANAFVSLGLIGGLLYAGLIVRVYWLALRQWHVRRDAVSLAVVGILVAAWGQWLSGMMYSVVPMIWLLIGWLDRESASVSRRLSGEADGAWEGEPVEPALAGGAGTVGSGRVALPSLRGGVDAER